MFSDKTNREAITGETQGAGGRTELRLQLQSHYRGPCRAQGQRAAGPAVTRPPRPGRAWATLGEVTA